MRSISFKGTLNFKQDPVSFLGCIGQVAMGKFSKEIIKRLSYYVYANKCSHISEKFHFQLKEIDRHG